MALIPQSSGIYTAPVLIMDTKELTHKIATLLLSHSELTLPERYQPIIGIPVSISEGQQGPVFSIDAVGAWAIERMGGSALLLPIWPLPPSRRIFQSLWPVIRHLDGLFLPARSEYSNENNWYERWQQPTAITTPNIWTLRWEMGLIQLATFVGMPILGVGDGAEKWNVALGGSLYPSVVQKRKRWASPQQLPPDRWPRKELHIRQYTKMSALLASAQLSPRDQIWSVPSTPQCEIEHLAPGLQECGATREVSLAAFERTDTTFGAGFLGRIDWALEQSTPIWEAFVNASRNYATVRPQNEWDTLRDTICTSVLGLVSARLPLLSPPAPAPAKVRMKRTPSIPLATTLPDGPGSVAFSHTLTKKTQMPTVQQMRDYKKRLLQRQQHTKTTMRNME